MNMDFQVDYKDEFPILNLSLSLDKNMSFLAHRVIGNF